MAGLHTLKRTTARAKRRVGRGQSSTRGKTSGRGTKGQSARAGNKKRPEMRDIIKKLPKRRGFGKNRGRTVVGTRLDTVAISLTRVGEKFEQSSEVTPRSLAERFSLRSHGRMLPAKIVGGSESFGKKLFFKGVAMSASARTAIEKAGGTIE